MAVYPIWKNVMVTSSITPLNYTVLLNDVEVYKGTAHKMPGALATSFNLSNIAKDYLSSKVVIGETTSQEVLTWKGVFKVVNSSGLTLATHTLYNDWSYGIEYRKSVISLAEPIMDYVDPRQLIVTSVGNLSQSTSAVVSITVDGNNRFTGNVNNLMTISSKLLSDADVGSTITISGANSPLKTLEIKHTNAKYCIYYMNAHGGYDSFLVRGNSMRSDTYNRTNVVRSVSDAQQHSKDTILNSITAKWELYTDYLTDVQYQRLHHLLGSTSVYLHDLESDEITPVTITNNITNYQTYSNQGRKLSYVKIDVESAQERMRM